MPIGFKELDFQSTPMGELSLRRRRILSLDIDVLEVKLGEEFLMSSLFTVGERALATLALEWAEGDGLDVLVGGLGLGYTAATALDNDRVKTLTVVDAMPAVIDWHRRGLVDLGPRLTGDPRCSFIQGDFYALVDEPDEATPVRLYDLILLDIDHSPQALLHPDHARFYSADGLTALARHLRPGGIFAMWSDAAPDAGFEVSLNAAFATSQARIVPFDNPLQDRQATCTIYLARTASRPPEPLSTPETTIRRTI